VSSLSNQVSSLGSQLSQAQNQSTGIIISSGTSNNIKIEGQGNNYVMVNGIKISAKSGNLSLDISA
jgi:hypothetical protein